MADLRKWAGSFIRRRSTSMGMVFTKEEDKQNPLAVPVLIKDFKHTPPTQVLLAAHDPLHDDGKILVENLRTSGVTTEVVVYEEMIHGFMHMDSVLLRFRMQ